VGRGVWKEGRKFEGHKATYGYVTKHHTKNQTKIHLTATIEDINSVMIDQITWDESAGYRKDRKRWSYNHCMFHILRLSRLEKYKLLR
jgi:hypothetical protein